MEEPDSGFVDDDVAIAERALGEYDLSPNSVLRLLNLSENATYAVEDPDTGGSSILRVHRQNYHRRNEIESELDWLAALRRDSDVPILLLTARGESAADFLTREIAKWEPIVRAAGEMFNYPAAPFDRAAIDHTRRWVAGS